jgi:hypothetical protein
VLPGAQGGGGFLVVHGRRGGDQHDVDRGIGEQRVERLEGVQPALFGERAAGGRGVVNGGGSDVAGALEPAGVLGADPPEADDPDPHPPIFAALHRRLILSEAAVRGSFMEPCRDLRPDHAVQ